MSLGLPAGAQALVHQGAAFEDLEIIGLLETVILGFEGEARPPAVERADAGCCVSGRRSGKRCAAPFSSSTVIRTGPTSWGAMAASTCGGTIAVTASPIAISKCCARSWR